MKAKKQNRSYTITPDQATQFIKEGYDVYDDDGNIVAYGAGKMISYAKYAALQAIIDKQKDHIEALENEIFELNKQIVKKNKKGEITHV